MQGSWEKDVLKAIGAPVTSGNIRLLRTWQRWEGGHTKNKATYNWLNTTKGKQFPGINSVGVRAFPDYKTGVAYTADTIIGGYPSVIRALRSGKPYHPKWRAPLLSDFSKWVSGSRTANMDYGQRILGTGSSVPTYRSPLARKTSSTNPTSRNQLDMSTLAGILDDGDDFWDLIQMDPSPALAKPASKPHAMTQAEPNTGKGFQVPASWGGTHVTDKLGWDTKTAHDFILNAGTALFVPESGKVIKHGSAQGGQSLWFKGDSGKMYWFGHIDGLAPVGARLKRGQKFGVVSSDHDTPHLHADVQ